MKKFKIKTGDTVIVISGKDKGKTGNVSSILNISFGVCLRLKLLDIIFF